MDREFLSYKFRCLKVFKVFVLLERKLKLQDKYSNKNISSAQIIQQTHSNTAGSNLVSKPLNEPTRLVFNSWPLPQTVAANAPIFAEA